MTDHHFHDLTVAKIQQETNDAVSIVFNVPSELQDLYLGFTQGQHLVMKADIQGQEIRRNYSICSGVHDGELRVGIKKIEGGLFSSFANDELKEGDTLAVMPPEGSFNTPLDPAARKHYLGFAAGSGITPILSILKTTLESEPNSVFTLVYGNKSVSNMMFRETILGLKNRYPERFQLLNVLSREEQESEILNGRINAEKVNMLADKVLDVASVNEAYICGPQDMTEAIRDTLQERGMDKKNIHFELFGVAPTAAKKQTVNPEDAGPVRQVAVIVDGMQTNLEVAEGGVNILDAALEAGADLPFACKGGVCCTCRAKVVEGEVKMDVNYALEDWEVEEGFVLTCQCHPTTDKVVIDFDEK